MNKLFAIIKAGSCLLYRLISTPISRMCLYVKNKVRLWGKVRFTYSTKISIQSEFEGANTVGANTYFSGSMGYGSYLCDNCSIIGNIGRFCSIAPDVKNSLGVHPISAPYVSTSPMFFSLRKQSGETFARQQLYDEIKSPIEVGHDCWIGQGVFIVGGVKIGVGAVVLAGAVVTKDVPSYAVVGGVPATILKYRYDQETIDFLLQSEWWNFSHEWLRSNYELFSDINEFKKVVNEIIDNNRYIQ